MALPIASIPVLTGEVARRFEAEAQATYEKFLNRTPEEEEAVRERYDRGIERVQTWMAWKTYDWLMYKKSYPAEIWIRATVR